MNIFKYIKNSLSEYLKAKVTPSSSEQTIESHQSSFIITPGESKKETHHKDTNSWQISWRTHRHTYIRYLLNNLSIFCLLHLQIQLWFLQLLTYTSNSWQILLWIIQPPEQILLWILKPPDIYSCGSCTATDQILKSTAVNIDPSTWYFSLWMDPPE